jgi:hypothetical protein
MNAGHRSSVQRRASKVAVLACAAVIWLVATPRADAQTHHLRVAADVSLSVNCNEPGCDCVDAGGAPAVCPATNVRHYDSGDVVAPTSDSYTAAVYGTFVGFASTTTSSMDSTANAAFGTMKGMTMGHSDSAGAYVDAGGLAIPGIAHAFVRLEFSDSLTLTGAIPGGPAMISFTQSITSSDTESLGGGGLSINPCLANGDARTQVDAVLTVFILDGGDEGSVGYDRFATECGAPQINGSPIDTVTVTGTDGDIVRVSQGVTLDSYARMDGGLGTNPNRARSADALLDASSTAHLYVEVLTPGASYASSSGTIYATPEIGASAAGVTAFAALAATRRLRHRS